MKKLSIIFGVVILMMASCARKYPAQEIDLLSQEDSLNYAIGTINGMQFKNMYFRTDSSDVPITEFIEAFDKAQKEGVEEDNSDYATAGKKVGMFFKSQTQNGLAGNKAWKYEHEIVCQGFVNGLYEYTAVFDTVNPQAYLQAKFAAAQQAEQPDEIAPAKANSKCPKTAADIKLATELDSLNYVFGYLNGEMMAKQMIAGFTTDSIDIIIDNLNSVLKTKYKYPGLVSEAQNVVKALSEMPGLFNDSTIPVDFTIIRQAFINGMREDTVMMQPMECQMYIQSTMQLRSQKQSEPNRIAGEEFLAQNAQRQGVVVTESGLQYEILKKGKGKVHPSAVDTVNVHYHGTLIDGTVFDSSVERGEPISFPLNGVIKGWTEGVQLMVEGDKFRFYIPYQLAYGDRDMGTIKPFSALIFDVELLNIKPKKDAK